MYLFYWSSYCENFQTCTKIEWMYNEPHMTMTPAQQLPRFLPNLCHLFFFFLRWATQIFYVIHMVFGTHLLRKKGDIFFHSLSAVIISKKINSNFMVSSNIQSVFKCPLSISEVSFYSWFVWVRPTVTFGCFVSKDITSRTALFLCMYFSLSFFLTLTCF